MKLQKVILFLDFPPFFWIARHPAIGAWRTPAATVQDEPDQEETIQHVQFAA
jgi:hypothetical protein